MNRIMKYRRSAAILALMLSAAACDDPTVVEEPEVAVTVTPTAPTMNVGGQITFTATVANDGTGAVNGVTWSSNNTSIVTVNAQSGVATGVAPGQAIVRATSNFDPTKSFSVSVTVNPNAVATITTLGIGPVPERYTAEIAAGRGFAYTTSWGFRAAAGNVVKIWNVSGTTPMLVDSLRIAQAGTTSDVQISPDSSLLVVSVEGGAGSIVIFSLANPAMPTMISRFQNLNTGRGVHTVKLSRINNRLYAFLQIDPGAGAPAALMIVDITNPQAPEEVYYQPMGRPYIHDVFVRDGILFAALWHDGMSIFDVGGGGRGGSPSNPVLMGNVTTPTGQIHNIWWVHDPDTGAKRYALLGEEGPGGVSARAASGDIHVIDVQNMSAPVQVAVYSVPGAGAHNFVTDEESGVLYAAYYNGGVRALDVRGDLGSCTDAERATDHAVAGYRGMCDMRKMGRELATALTDGTFYIWGVTMQGNRLYASDMGKGIIALDISALKR